jgi:hypothetical protein
MKIQALCRLELVINSGFDRYPIPLTWWKSIQVKPTVARAGELLALEFGSQDAGGLISDATLLLSQAGTYEIECPPLPGLEGSLAIANFVVAVTAKPSEFRVDRLELGIPK